MPRFPALSPSTSSLSDRVFSALVEKAKGRSGPIYPLHVGDTYLDPLPAARAEAQRSSEFPSLHAYAPVAGEPDLVRAIVDRLTRRAGVAPGDVQITAGATAGLNAVAAALLDPGDEVLMPSPFWPLMRGIIAMRGAKLVEVPFWTELPKSSFDPERAIAEAITDRTVAIYLNSPNNPTGAALPEGLIGAVAKLAAKHDLWVIDDEAYEELVYGPSQQPLWAEPALRDRVIAAHTLSKGYGFAGARVGWVHGPSEAMKAIRGTQTFLSYCAPRPMQRGAIRAIREGDAWLAEAVRLYREAGAKAASALGQPAPAGGTFLFFDTRPHRRAGEDLEGFLERCLAAGLLLTPGSASGPAHYTEWARLCFTAVPPKDLDDALARLASVLSAGP